MKLTRKFTHSTPGSGNFILEGDNLHSLEILSHTHAKKVDCIYIDPPYNTGNNHFVYKDNFKNNDKNPLVSEWFRFMEPRLKLGYQILKDDGVLFVSIDDSELASSLVLLDHIFSKNNRIAVFCKKLSGGKNDSKFVRKNHEYLLVYGKSKNSIKRLMGRKKDSTGQTDQQLNKWGDTDRRVDRPNLYYPIYVNEKSGEISVEKFSGSIAVYPIKANKEEGRWRWSKSKVKDESDKLIAKRRSNGEIGIYVKAESKSNTEGAWDSVIDGFAGGGGDQIKELFGDAKYFTYAKNLDYLKWITSLVKGDNLLFLDFFAGSGTTGHAIIEQNATDGKKRNFILCSNTEASDKQPAKNICRQICAERIKKSYAQTEAMSSSEKRGFDYFEIVPANESTRKQQVDSVLNFLQIKLNLSNLQSPLTSIQEERGNIFYAGTDQKGMAYFISMGEINSSILDKVDSKTEGKYRHFRLDNLEGVKALFGINTDTSAIQLELIA